LREIVAL